MNYLLQIEFKNKKAHYWLPILCEVSSSEEASKKLKDISDFLNSSFDKILATSITEYDSNFLNSDILKNYIENERTGNYKVLQLKNDVSIENPKDDSTDEVVFDKNFYILEYAKDELSYLDFQKNTILTRKISTDITNFDSYLIVNIKPKVGAYMEPKKYPHADLEKLRSTVLLGGIVVSLLIIYAMINFKFYDVQASELGDLVVEEIEEEIIPITEQNTPPPPPPPPPAAPETIEIVEDDVEIEEEIEIDTEADAETVVETFEVEEEVVEEEIFTIVEDMPEFPGGIKALYGFLKDNVEYPPAAKANGISGKVFVNFTVEKDGSITAVKVIRGVHELLDKEAIRVVKSFPKWKPGKQRGKSVRVSYNIPISFVLK